MHPLSSLSSLLARRPPLRRVPIPLLFTDPTPYGGRGLDSYSVLFGWVDGVVTVMAMVPALAAAIDSLAPFVSLFFLLFGSLAPKVLFGLIHL
jgi:hypothetical protein